MVKSKNKENIGKKYFVLWKKEEWREAKLGDVTEIVMGQSPKSETYNESGIGFPFYQGVVDFGDRFVTARVYCSKPKKIIESGDILLSVRAPVGRVNFTKEKCSIGRGNAGLRMNNGIQNFLFYLLKFYETDLHSSSSGSVFSSISKSDIQNLVILFPILSEQKAIAEVLSSLDDKIDLLHRQNKTLEAIAQTLFRQWFIEEAQSNWQVVYLSDIYDFIKGCEPGSKFYEDKQTKDNVRFIRVGDMLDNVGNTYIEASKATALCEISDLLVSFDGTVGKVASKISGAYSSGIRKIVSTDSIYDNFGFKYLLFKTKIIQDTIQEHATGTVILHASSSIDYLNIHIPNKNKIQQFNNTIKPFFEKIFSNQTKIRTLENLRNVLLPKLLNGKVRVKIQ